MLNLPFSQQCNSLASESSLHNHVQLFVTLRTVACLTPLFMEFSRPGSTGVGCHSLLQGIFLTQGLNMGSCTTGEFFTNWATRETIHLAPLSIPMQNSTILWTSQVAASAGDPEKRVWSLSQKNPLEKEMTTHSSILAWRIPWTEEPGRLQSTVSQKARHDRATENFRFSPHCIFKVWRIFTMLPKANRYAPYLFEVLQADIEQD